MGGSIAVSSEAGAGSVFTVDLPFAYAPDDLIGSPERCGNGQRVLVVNRTEELRTHFCDVLALENFRVDEASDAKTALRKLGAAAQRGLPFEMCFIKWDTSEDMQLFVAQIRKTASSPALKIILTGQDKDELNDAAAVCGADATLCRPVFRSNLAAVGAGRTGQTHAQPKTAQSTALAGAHVLLAEDLSLIHI